MIVDFLDKFYNELLTEDSFNKYKQGYLDFKKLPYRDIATESEAMVKEVVNFNRQPDCGIDWNMKQKVIDYATEHCTY